MEVRFTIPRPRPGAPMETERENIWTVPNLFSTIRLLLSPCIAYLVIQEEFPAALVILCIAGVTDFLDGCIARAFPSQASRLGSILDPVADKVLITTLFVTLSIVGLIPVALTALVVTRDVLLVVTCVVVRITSLPPPRTFERLLDFSQTVQLSPTVISKVNTAVQLITAVLTLTDAVLETGWDKDFLIVMWALTAATTIVSGVYYIFAKNTFMIESSTG
ncbi:cardiolipin synthase (CMP-forming)-like [Macrosteles quadrilineatus]|uniref:cardiolipin synthase (CMP-forming)-like n=1 Tax=Macrosteles quadrilineatus TaxID=74068 RepID=UPI0023E2F8E1|nr:cardiolipin synthase (CMP-forming)-like [Macrosteles quadrilineatus]